ncbi:hypothetical protein INT43_005815 [Umbelopsis isabellina]|uniref:Uncharacterized protein n=1 Tax=Mortierella isabellina TaxID=91625 RepID=A0A8H7UAU6_MORIS|nr:hypothetical protein INT43_005815 [Umbelopsis isabellina]
MEEVKRTKLVIQLLKNREYQENPQSKPYKLQICKIHGKVPDAHGKELLFVELADAGNSVFALIPTSPTFDDDFDRELTPGIVIRMKAKANYHVMSHGSKLGVHLLAQEYKVLCDGTAVNETLLNVNDNDEIRKSLIEVERMLSAGSDDKFARLINIDELKDRAVNTEKLENDVPDIEMKLDSDYDSESDADLLLAIGGENESDPHLHNQKSYSSPDPKRAKLLPVQDSAQPTTNSSNVVEDFGWKQSKWVQDYECIIPEDQQRILSMLDGWSLTESKLQATPQATPRVNNSSNLIEVPCEVECHPIPMSQDNVNRNTNKEESIDSVISQFIRQRQALQAVYTPKISFTTI